MSQLSLPGAMALFVLAGTALAAGPCGPGNGDCCVANGTPGCDDIDCCQTVCAVDPFCCDVTWDGICAGEALSLCAICTVCDVQCQGTPELEACGGDTNGGCNSTPPVFATIDCGETYCGTAWAENSTRDTDWYLIDVPAADTTLTATLVSEFAGVVYIIDGIAGCAPVIVGQAGDSDMCAPGLPAVASVGPGTFVIFAATSGFDGVPCGSPNDYELTLTCDAPSACQEIHPGICWISMDGSPPGTPPSVNVEQPMVPDPHSTVVEITVHGFYVEEVVEGLETFHRIIVPDPDFGDVDFDPITSPPLPGEHELLRPELAYHSMMVGVITDAPALELEDVAALDPDPPQPPEEPEPFFTLTEHNGLPMNVIPAQPSIKDCDCCGDGPPFDIDQGFYDTFADFYPETLAQTGPLETWMTVKVGRVQVNLAQFHPQAALLRVAKRIRVALGHGGNVPAGPAAPDTSLDLDQVFARIVNFNKIRNFFNQLVQVNYLIIVHSDLADAIEPLRQMKVNQGLNVTRIKAFNAGPVAPPDILAAQADVQAAIRDFYNGSRGLAIPYVLLVGDVDRIPAGGTVVDPADNQTGYSDKPYVLLTPAPPAAADRIPDMPIARLSADNVAQLEGIVAKIVRYQTTPLAGPWLNKVLLAVHRRVDARTPDRYLANQCEVQKLLAGLAAPPAISYAPGRVLGAGEGALCGPSAAAGNNYVESRLNEGMGVVGYRGHGCPDQWQDWSIHNQGPGGTAWTIADITAADVMNGCANPVVFAMCCWNGQFDTVPAAAPAPCGANVADGISERWMQIGGAQNAAMKGAVAHYGAVIGSFTHVNNPQNKDTFKGLYKDGITRLGLLTMRAEAKCIKDYTKPTSPPNTMTQGELHALMYNWQGDPHMAVRLVPAAPGAPSACCPGDTNGDGSVGVSDLVAVILAWGTPGTPFTDVNGDGTVNVTDLVFIITNWGVC